MENSFNFLRVLNGRTYFARVEVSGDVHADGVHISKTAGRDIPAPCQHWLASAQFAASAALQAHLEQGGEKIGLIVTSVLGTEIDTNQNSIEVAGFCAAWKALGRKESLLKIRFDRVWHVEVEKDIH